MNTCSVDQCDNLVYARNLCNKHYSRLRRHGDPLVTLQAEDGAPQKFIETALSHQDDKECLFWPYSRTGGGYAKWSNTTEETQLVCRIICKGIKGPPPTARHEAAHSCGRGHLGCVNPHHLEWKTSSENEADKIIHGTDSIGERSGKAKLTWVKVWEIKALKGKLSGRKVAATYDVSKATIYCIWNGKLWKE
jgi:hypothetical protein